MKKRRDPLPEHMTIEVREAEYWYGLLMATETHLRHSGALGMADLLWDIISPLFVYLYDDT